MKINREAANCHADPFIILKYRNYCCEEIGNDLIKIQPTRRKYLNVKGNEHVFSRLLANVVVSPL